MALDQIASFHTTRTQRARAGEVQQVPPEPTPVRKLIGNNLLVSVASGPLAGHTINYDFNLVNFDYRTWHEYEWQNWTMVDALLNSAFRGVENLSVWQPDTDYAVGDVVVSTETGLAYECLVAHNSDSDSILNDIALGYWSETVVGASYTKQESDDRYVNVDGDTMSGPLTVNNVVTVGGSAAAGVIVSYAAAVSANINVAPALPLLIQFAGTTRHRFEANGALTNTTSVPTRAAGDARWLQLAGGTMTGPLIVLAPTATGHAATKGYVDAEIDDAIAGYVPAAGGTFTGPVLFSGVATFTDTSFPTPDDDNDAATKKYVDDAVSGGGVSPYVKKTGDTMTGTLRIDAGSPALRLYETDQAVGAKAWQQYVTGGTLLFATAADDYTGLVTQYRMDRDSTQLPATQSIVTRASGDARYIQLSTQTIVLEGTSPSLALWETDGATANNRVRHVLDTNLYQMQTRDNANTLKGSFYKGTMSATGVSQHEWLVNNTLAALLNASGLEITGNIKNSGLLQVGTSIECGTGLYVNDDSNPMLTFRNAAKQTGGMVYTDGAGVLIVRPYESFVSSNYTNYYFRYGGATNNDDVLRIREGDARYLRLGTGNNNLTIESDAPYIMFNQTDQASNMAWWSIGASGTAFVLQPRDSVGNVLSSGGSFSIVRDVDGIIDVRFGNGPGGDNAALPASNSIVTRASGDARYALASAGTYAMYTSSSNSELTSFPIGSILLVNVGNTNTLNRNASSSVNISTASAHKYVRGNDANVGAALSGTWRAKGAFTVEGGNEGEAQLMQRVA